MKQILVSFIILLLFFDSLAFAVDAQENNKFGIHLAQPEGADIKRAAELVNSNGGKWGYVTLVIQENDRDINKWQGVFDLLRELRLIPIIRLATQPVSSNWRRPDVADADQWLNFLNTLNWVVQDRYIILFNEPNHATEWGGKVNTSDYAKVAAEFASKFKESNKDYFIMLAGLDASAPSQLPNYEDERIFLEEVIREIEDDKFNKLFDGLSSHSYPNPGFVGSVYGSGRGSVRNYEWELIQFARLGVKDLPVFITETGWHGEALNREEVAENFRIAFNEIWLPDDRVMAVTPFILNYQSEPFLKFSWVKPGNDGVYPEYHLVQNLKKQPGRPDIKQSGNFIFDLPREIVEKSTYHFQIQLENTGQAILSKDENYALTLEGVEDTRYFLSSMGEIKPFEKKVFDVYVKTLDSIGETEGKFVLRRDDEAVLESGLWKFVVVPLPSLHVGVPLFPKFAKTSQTGFELQIYDEYEEMVFRASGLTSQNGVLRLPEIENIALDRKYRVVVLKKYYLPRQGYVVFKKGDNGLTLEPMLAVDFSGDGALDWNDIVALFGDFRKASLLFP